MPTAPVLRVYHPHECHPLGHPLALQPLDWECCRTCRGSGGVQPPKAGWPDAQGRILATKYGTRTCPTCRGHGSLRAAALAYELRGEEWALRTGGGDAEDAVHRCEDCNHPMSEGTWESRGFVDTEDAAWLGRTERAGYRRPVEMQDEWAVHYSPCASACRHREAGRWRRGSIGPWESATNVRGLAPPVEASWRPVDIRTLSFPNILLPECLAVLCLRCHAARSSRPRQNS
jgi:hypothetical protein